MKPHHIAVSLGGNKTYARRKGIPLGKAFAAMIAKTTDFLKWQVKHKIPIITLNLMKATTKSDESFSAIVDAVVKVANELAGHELVHNQKIKISVIGQWYDLPERAVDAIKEVINATRDYDSFFLNLCINYDGKEEILDACKLLARKVHAGKIEPDAITAEMIKENIYSSFFMPPDLIIKAGMNSRLGGFLLWDSTDSFIHLAEKPGVEITEDDFLTAIRMWGVAKE